MDHKSITFTVVADLFLLLLIGVGPKIALVPFLEITADMDDATKRRVARKMLTTAAIVSMLLLVLGEVLRRLLHFSIGSLSIASGLILVIIAVYMVLGSGDPEKLHHRLKGQDPMRLAVFPLAVPYVVNPAGIVALMTVSAEAASISYFALAVGLVAIVLALDVVVSAGPTASATISTRAGCSSPRRSLGSSSPPSRYSSRSTASTRSG